MICIHCKQCEKAYSNGWCRECMREYYMANCEKRRAYQRRYEKFGKIGKPAKPEEQEPQPQPKQLKAAAAKARFPSIICAHCGRVAILRFAGQQYCKRPECQKQEAKLYSIQIGR